MKTILLLGLLPLTGCAVDNNLLAFATVGVNVASIMTIQRTPTDAVYSLATGRDCSVVRLDRGQTYCRPVEPPPQSPAYCVHTLATATCFTSPADLPGQPRGVADGPSTLTPEQEADRVRRWPE